MGEQWLQDWLKQAQNPFVMYGGGAMLLSACYVIWRVSRRIVWIGYFVFFAAIGFGLASVASLVLLRQLAPLPFLYTAAIGFAAFVSAVRSKVLKVVGAATVLIVCQTMGGYWVKAFPKESPKPAPPKSAKAIKRAA